MVYSRAALGVEAPLVRVEAHLSGGLEKFTIVGLPEAVVKESKDRVRSAILNNRFEFPFGRITINLSPAELPKEGGRFDLAIALAILAASQQVPQEILSAYEFAAELGLSGELRAIRGILPFALATKVAERALILPQANAEEASWVSELKLFAAQDLLQVCAHLQAREEMPLYSALLPEAKTDISVDLSEVKGQAHAKRALEVAASGGHSLLMMGPPGAGKTMLASRLPSILPELSETEALSVAAIYSLLPRSIKKQDWRQRPFRAPHHTASGIALVGGSRPPNPGEISLAHQGVLFLDELPEFSRPVLEALREPLEAGVIRVSRASYQVEYPAQFQLIAAMNPCPCGYLWDIKHPCRCSEEQVRRYLNKISGPFRDRLDMSIELPAVSARQLAAYDQVETGSSIIRARVIQARERQYRRAHKLNAHLNPKEIEQYCRLTIQDQLFFEEALTQLGLSARSYHRILKLARTLADMAGRDDLLQADLLEALSYRRLWSDKRR